MFGFREDIVQQDTVRSVNYFSGVVEDGGISSATGGILMIDNRGNQAFIPNCTGRSFKDEDEFSPLDDWPFTKALKTSDEKNGVLTNGFGIKVQN